MQDMPEHYTLKGVDAFHKHFANKGFVEERGFKVLVEPFKNKVERRGWETVIQHMEPSRRAFVKEFYTNLGKRKILTCYVKGRWVPFKEKAISQLLGLGSVGNCIAY